MRWIGVLAATVLVVLAACGPEEPGGSPSDPDPALAEAFGEGEWLLVEGVEMVEGYPITLRGREGGVGGTAACNSYSAQMTVDGERLEIGDITVTEMGCPEPGVHDSEAAFLDALQAAERYQRTDDRLLLAGPGVELLFEAAPPVEDASLTGTDWQLESLLAGAGPDGTASSTTAEATLHLADDGTFTGSDGCNDLSGGWELQDGVLHLSDTIQTDVACPDIEQQVEHVQAVLLGEPTVTLDGRQLRLTAGDRALDYRAP